MFQRGDEATSSLFGWEIGSCGGKYGNMGIGIISTNRGDFTFQSTDDVIKFIRTAAQENNDIWISGEQPYPCMAVCINGGFLKEQAFSMSLLE